MHRDEYEDVPGESLAHPSNGFDSDGALSFAYMGQSGFLDVTGHPGILPLDDPPVLSDDLWYEDGVLNLAQPGIYLVAFALVVPLALAREAEIRLFLHGKDLPGGHSVFTVRMEVKNVTELENIRNKLLNIRDVIGSRRGQN